jgi:hypothetical protein
MERRMTQFTVRRGRRYKATFALGLVEQLAGNETIAERLRSAGFTDVHVTGEGRMRVAQALWPKDDATAAMPAQVSTVAEIEEA